MSRILRATEQLEDDVTKANVFVHGDEDATYTAKDGEKVPSIRNLNKRAEVNIDAAKGAAINAEKFAKKSELAATAAQVGSGIFLSIQEGLSATNSGDLFSVVDAYDNNFISLYQNNSGIAEEIKKYPSAEAVIEKSPFLKLVKNGISSPRNDAMLSFISDISVLNADLNKYYQISYFQNNADLNGVSRDSWIVKEFDSEDFKINSSGLQILTTQQISPEIDRNLDNQIIELRSPFRPQLRFILSIKPNQLCIGPIFANSENSDGYSWIINPTRYFYYDISDSLTINSGKAFPLKSDIRDGIISRKNVIFSDFILDVKVNGARNGKKYSIAFQNNGALSNSSLYGWVIYESSNWAIDQKPFRCVDHGDDSPEIKIEDGIQKVIVESHKVKGLSFEIILDASKLPKLGIAISSMDPKHDGYSWIIDPITYEQKEDQSNLVDLIKKNSSQILVDYNMSSKELIAIFNRDSKYQLRIVLKPNGFNRLFNIYSIEVGEIGSDQFEFISKTDTDWFPPMVIESTTQPFDESATKIYTGGNHGSDGSSGGSPTAVMRNIEVFLDGITVDKNSQKYVNEIVVKWMNELMAYNTISSERYVVEQHFNVVISLNNLEIWSDIVATENIICHTDNACQMVSSGFDTVYYAGGSTLESHSIEINSSSGSSKSFPKCFAAVLVSNNEENGLQASWIDNNYGLGDGSQIGGAAAKFRRGSGSNSKIYSAAISNSSYPLSYGDSYQWHGGYSWAGLDGFIGIENAFVINNKGVRYLAYGTSAQKNKGVVKYPLIRVGETLDNTVIGASERLLLNGEGPISKMIKIE